jgi:hypothetical protein
MEMKRKSLIVAVGTLAVLGGLSYCVLSTDIAVLKMPDDRVNHNVVTLSCNGTVEVKNNNDINTQKSSVTTDVVVSFAANAVLFFGNTVPIREVEENGYINFEDTMGGYGGMKVAGQLFHDGNIWAWFWPEGQSRYYQLSCTRSNP